jgi:hypothetical protein
MATTTTTSRTPRGSPTNLGSPIRLRTPPSNIDPNLQPQDIGNIPTASSSGFPSSSTRPPPGHFYQGARGTVTIPSLEEELKGYKAFNHEDDNNPWKETQTMVVARIHHLEHAKTLDQSKFRISVAAAYRKWREHLSPFPRVYPSEQEWEQAPVGMTDLIHGALTLNKIQGMDSNQRFSARYFTNYRSHQIFIEELRSLAESYNYTPKFKYPSWDLPTHTTRNGMTYDEALLASFMYQAEAEALKYELIMVSSSEHTNESFLTNPQDRFKWTKPLWASHRIVTPSTSSAPQQPSVTLRARRKPAIVQPAATSTPISALPLRSSIPPELCSHYIQEEIDSVPPLDSAEFEDTITLLGILPKEHRKKLATGLGYGSKLKAPKVPVTIEEVSDEDHWTYDPNQFTTMEPLPDQPIRAIRRSIAQNVQVRALPQPPDTYASTAHFGIGSLRKTILQPTRPQIYETDPRDIEDEQPILVYTPRASIQPKLIEQAAPPSPQLSDISVNSCTFRIHATNPRCL